MNKSEIRITGLGGQGVILSAYVIGKAFAIFDKKFATMNQSFGPEARGSACSAQLILSDERILYPYLQKPDILVAMSQEGFNKHVSEIDEDGIFIVEEDLVKPEETNGKGKIYKCPATRIAEELGRKIVLNIVMLGFFTKVSGLVSAKAMKEAIASSVPKGTEELNLKAFDSGYNYQG